VVLPLSLTGDGVLADGVSEEIIAALAAHPELFVIAADTAFEYKGQPDAPARVAEELGVRYVLQGSMRGPNDRLAITARLVDVLSGRYVWQEPFEREWEIGQRFEQDIANAVIASLEPDPAGIDRRLAHGSEARRPYLLGLGYFRRLTPEDNRRAQAHFEIALDLEPGYTRAWTALARTHETAARRGWAEDPVASFARAAELARIALDLDPSDADADALLGALAMLDGDHERALDHGERAVALAPNNADARASLAATLVLSGEPDRAITLLIEAMRLNPFFPAWYLGELGHAYRLTRQYDEAITALTAWRDRVPQSPIPHLQLAITLAEMDRAAEARDALAAFLERLPNFSTAQLAGIFTYRSAADLERLTAAARKAGMQD
jgi:adenylate cyclase